MKNIAFFEEGVRLNLRRNHTREGLEAVIKKLGMECGEISFIFCTDEYLYKLNQEYLSHDTFTDIITFDYSEGKKIAGDIFISLERVKENAKTFNVKIENELVRVMIHGVLHLSGYKDKTPSENKQMHLKEDEMMQFAFPEL